MSERNEQRMAQPVPRWYVLYTRPQAEKKSAQQLEKMGLTVFLPTHQVERQWSDRKKTLHLPLFPNYLFVHLDARHLFQALQARGIVEVVRHGGKPAPVSEYEIECLRKLSTSQLPLHPMPTPAHLPEIGQRVMVTKGHLAGVEGTLQRVQGKNRLIIEIATLRQAVSLEIPAHYIEEVQQPKRHHSPLLAM